MNQVHDSWHICPEEVASSLKKERVNMLQAK